MQETRPRSHLEELANTLTHGIALVGSIVAAPVLVIGATGRGRPALVVGASVFAGSLIVLYAASTLYHALPPSRAKKVCRLLDHSAIYLLIAGTYTPFTLGVLRGAWGWTLFGAVWALAALGLAFKLRWRFRFGVFSTAVYLLMGWMCLAAIGPLSAHVPTVGLAWLVAGGLCYSFGVVFYALERVRFAHTLWHVSVIGGSTCHFFAVLWYSA